MSKAGNIGLAVLAVLAVGAAGYAVVTVNEPHPSAENYTPPATATAEPPDPVWTLDDARAVLDQDQAVISVLGDSTGNEPGEWVDLWTDTLDGDVQVSTWVVPHDGTEFLPVAGEWVGDTGGDVQVWNASVPGARAGLMLENLDQAMPEDPDLVMVSLGHNHRFGNIREVEFLMDAVAEQHPEAVLVVLLQQPQVDDANAPMRGYIADYAVERGLPVVDVAAAYEQDGRDLAELLTDDVHPNAEGSRVWADAVAEALGG